MIGSANRGLLTKVVIKHWDISAKKNQQTRSAFTWLMDATKLQSLHIDCSMGLVSGVNGRVKQIYFACQKFIEAYGAAKGRKDAAVDVIQLADSNFETKSFYGWRNAQENIDAETNKAAYVKGLAEIL